MIQAVVGAVDCPVVVLVRGRAGDFVYSPVDAEVMFRDAIQISSMGVEGIAVGALQSDGRWDLDFMKRVAQGVSGCRLVAHRAIDQLLGSETRTVRQARELLEPLIELGYHRILSGGGQSSAELGVDTLARLVEAARGQIEIVPAGGISPGNAREILARSGARQVHGSFRRPRPTRGTDFVDNDPCAIKQLKEVLKESG
jgi:copper homeostasis protein